MSAAILVTDGEQRASLAVVRSLGAAGYTVHVCSDRSRCIAGASRYCAGSHALPSPLAAPTSFGDRCVALARDLGAEILLPMTEASLLALLPRRDEFRGIVPFAPASSFSRISNKAEVLQAALQIGLSVPAAVTLRTPTDPVPGNLRFPIVVKPSRSVVAAGAGRQKTGVRYARDRATLDRVLGAAHPAVFPLMLQELIEGPGLGVFVLIWDGELLASFAHRRIREKPPSGGVSVLRESVRLPGILLERTLDLLQAFGWYGVAMVEYKQEARSGEAYLMEINGRFWGSLQLAIDAGVDFPRLLVEAALGQRPPAVTGYHLGVRSRWWWGDVDHVLAVLRRSPADRGVPLGVPGRWRTLLDFLRTGGPAVREEVFRRDDWRPFLQETRDWLRGR